MNSPSDKNSEPKEMVNAGVPAPVNEMDYGFSPQPGLNSDKIDAAFANR